VNLWSVLVCSRCGTSLKLNAFTDISSIKKEQISTFIQHTHYVQRTDGTKLLAHTKSNGRTYKLFYCHQGRPVIRHLLIRHSQWLAKAGSGEIAECYLFAKPT